MWHLSLLVFFRSGFKYEPYLCNGCHDLMQKSMNFNDVAIASIKESDYRIENEIMKNSYNIFS